MNDAPALVLLHGFTNSGASWEPVISGLGQRYRALAPDIRGHASASARMPVTLDAVIDDIAALADHRFTLVGYSQGGRIALHAALAMPERISRLVLIGAGPGLADDAERELRRLADERLARRIETLTIEQFAQEWAQTPVLDGVAPDVAARAHADRLRSTPAGLAAALRGLGTAALPSLWERLRELTMPVTLIVGERDGKFGALAAAMAQLIPDCALMTVPGAGHAVHLERPEVVAAELERFVPAV
jgi:2-succinyl-6-hydroxy-2,4-cyclohexadiene-1-carboxylate synthase